jgi:hypothetical protein
MRKNLLGLSIAAMIGGLGLAGTASAGVSFAGTGAATATNATVLRNAIDGVGHILLAPYFSTQSGNNTLLSIVNTDTTNGKAVKVRFRGAANSDDIFDFQVYLSPGDVWTANVSQNASGLSQLTTNDASCTIPSRSVLNSTPFVVGRLPAVSSTFTAAEQASWTREGYVEVLTMADIPPATGATTLFTQIKHVNGVAPGCPAGETTGAALLALNTDPATEAAAVALGFNTPTASLMGSATIINVAGAAAAWSANMDAIVGVNDAAAAPINSNTDYLAARGRIVFSPQTAITASNITFLTADPLLRAGTVTGANYDLPDLSTPYVGTAALAATGAGSPIAQAEALTKSLAVNSIQNEYLTTNAVINAATDWTFTMPTRRYAVAYNYAGTTAATQAVYNTGAASAYFTSGNVTVTGRLLCVNPGTGTSATSWGQDEQASSVTTGFVVSPSTLAPAFAFCGEAAVLAFSTNAANTVLNATIAKSTPGTAPISTAGWQTIPTPGLTGLGLPILGSAYVKVTGPAVNGASTNFSLTAAHRRTRAGF